MASFADHIALPSKSGAMENWGLITYSEYYLCAHEKKSPVTGYLIVAFVVAHELAHQVGINIISRGGSASSQRH